MRRVFWVPIAVAFLAGAELPEQGPVPIKKPEQSPAAPATPASPEQLPSPEAPTPDLPSAAKDPPPLPGITAALETAPELASCEAELSKLEVTFTRLDPVAGDNGCGVTAPYAVTEIAKGVTLNPATQLRCKTALSLARWVSAVVLPAVSTLPDDARLTEINHGSTYVCRRRNNLPTGKMSEHSIGNAIDIVDFEFEGRKPIGILPRAGDGNIEEAFQRALRGGACLHFTTVLGPGSDASHDDHLHFDIADRRGGYRLCE